MTEPTEIEPWTMPPEIAKAVSAVMGDVPKLAKGDKNTHGNYNFASIDDFLEAVRPLCAKHGLLIMQDEESFDVREATKGDGKTTATWLMLRWPLHTGSLKWRCLGASVHPHKHGVGCNGRSGVWCCTVLRAKAVHALPIPDRHRREGRGRG